MPTSSFTHNVVVKNADECRKLVSALEKAEAVARKEKSEFFSEANMTYLERVTAEIDGGATTLHEHELIEE